MNATLEKDIKAYELALNELLEHHKGKYVVFQDGQLIDAFDSFQNAASFAVDHFGLGPYLIRKVQPKQEVQSLPASVAFRPIHVAR